MIPRRDLRRAIELMGAGQAQAASAMLEAIIAEPELDDHARATAYVWLAESRRDREFKIDCLQRALEHEPGNAQVREALERLRGAGGWQPVILEAAPPVVGIRGGPNGPGSGFFVHDQGLVATTGYVTGSVARVDIDIENDRTVGGRVVRRFPASDLALVETPARIKSFVEAAPGMLMVRDDLVFALAYPSLRRRGVLRDVGPGLRSGWLLTSLSPGLMPDAGGNPVGDATGKLAGMLTRNVDHGSGGLYALGLGQIQRLAEQVLQERRLEPGADYCGACGSLTRAHRYGGRYCETCGARSSAADEGAGMPVDAERLRLLYDGGENQPCRYCAARLGFYGDRCLRCGRELEPQALWAAGEAGS